MTLRSTMPDGSYPIERCTGHDSVESAAKLAHHSKTYSFEQVKAHVMKAKASLGCPDSVLPASWKQSSSEESMRNSAPVGSEASDLNHEPETESSDAKSKATGGLYLRSLPVLAGKPRPSYYRLANPGPILRAAEDQATMPTMFGHFCVFNRWTHIDSWFEGEFMERVAPGATIKTITENRPNIKILFNHGGDPSIGKKVLGPIADVREDEIGTAFEVPLLDTSYNRDLMPGLEAGLYGTSYKFRVMKEQVDSRPKRSDYNPEGIEERTLQEIEVMEFGPVTFPQYKTTDVGLRSTTDDILRIELFNEIASDPERLVQLLGADKMRQLIESYGPALTEALSNDRAEAEASLAGESRDEGHEFPALVVIRNPNKER